MCQPHTLVYLSRIYGHNREGTADIEVDFWVLNEVVRSLLFRVDQLQTFACVHDKERRGARVARYLPNVKEVFCSIRMDQNFHLPRVQIENDQFSQSFQWVRDKQFILVDNHDIGDIRSLEEGLHAVQKLAQLC